MTTELHRAAQAMVRMYSFEVDGRIPSEHPAHALGQLLAQDRGDLQHVTQPWRSFYENSSPFDSQRNTVTQTVAIEANKLRDKWLVFHSNCSKEDQLNLHAFEPTIEGVVAAIGQAMAVWGEKRQRGWRGKAASNFHKVCGTLDSHNNMMRMLPEASEYVSVFTGALSTVIQASVNHEKIAEGLSAALCEIGEQVRDSTSELHLFPTEQMQRLISDLYAHIFLFLTSVMEWIMQKKYKRLIDSFNQNFIGRFKTEIDTIKNHAERIRQLAAQASRAETRVVRLTGEDMGEEIRELRRDIRVGLEEIARERAEAAYRDRLREMEAAGARRDREEIGQRTRFLATWLAQMLQQGSLTLSGSPQTLYRSPSPFCVASLQEVEEWTSDKALLHSRHFEDFFYRDRIRLSVENTLPAKISREVLYRLTEWSGPDPAPASVLWLKGEPTQMEDIENQLSVLAAQFIQLVDRTRIPVISYFCEQRRGKGLLPGYKTIEEQGMVSLGYALARQMIELLLPQFFTTADLSESRFARLDGTVISWHDLLSLLGDLAPLLPDIVYIIVDGLQWLDDRSTATMAKQLVSFLRGYKDKLRVLFTTSGKSGVLLEQLDTNEFIAVDNDMLQGDGFILERTDLLSPPGLGP